ncbi:hypothetical protein PHISCL_09537 [Aspergillus sclerotialis]|uniref:Uncharacterized protein n=1 Tax=Aspergillus sclerotialis TaxID=2070753 RepID=A0A3A2ZLT2_9EURO|nr:hypothetical protein PHISCL_09537 [Aspergillus sclerotialis]
MDTLMFRQRIQERMQQGERLTDDEIAFITKGSEDLAGTPPGELPDKTQWASRAEQVLRKPANEINMNDSKSLSSKEVCFV